MKRTIFFLFFGMLVLNAQAKIWRVNNTPSKSADFSDISTAISTASAGDTLYIEGSSIVYSSENVNITKSLCLIGPGYFLEKNDSTLYSKSNATFNSNVTIETTAPNTTLQGLNIIYTLNVLANNVIIERNLLNIVDFGLGVVSNTVIQNNYITGRIGTFTPSDYPSLYNLTISNNIINVYICTMKGNSVIENNTILSNGIYTIQYWPQYEPMENLSIIAVNSIISNNLCKGIIYTGRVTRSYGVKDDASNSIIKNTVNLGNNFTSQFLGGSIDDKYYMLSPTSTAIGAGTGGVDCGAFGGSDPYVLSGLPAIPHIYDIVAPTSGSATSGLAVKVKVKTQK